MCVEPRSQDSNFNGKIKALVLSDADGATKAKVNSDIKSVLGFFEMRNDGFIDNFNDLDGKRRVLEMLLGMTNEQIETLNNRHEINMEMKATMQVSAEAFCGARETYMAKSERKELTEAEVAAITAANLTKIEAAKAAVAAEAAKAQA